MVSGHQASGWPPPSTSWSWAEISDVRQSLTEAKTDLLTVWAGRPRPRPLTHSVDDFPPPPALFPFSRYL